MFGRWGASFGGDATTKCIRATLAATAVFFVCSPTAAQASRTVSPADEPVRYAYIQASGGAPDGSTQFGVGGGDCYSVFPPLPLTPASCTIVIQFDYSPKARGLSTGTLVIDGDTKFDTTADQITLPLSADVLAFKSKCKKKHPAGFAAAAKMKCKKKR